MVAICNYHQYVIIMIITYCYHGIALFNYTTTTMVSIMEYASTLPCSAVAVGVFLLLR